MTESRERLNKCIIRGRRYKIRKDSERLLYTKRARKRERGRVRERERERERERCRGRGKEKDK